MAAATEYGGATRLTHELQFHQQEGSGMSEHLGRYHIQYAENGDWRFSSHEDELPDARHQARSLAANFNRRTRVWDSSNSGPIFGFEPSLSEGIYLMHPTGCRCGYCWSLFGQPRPASMPF